MMPEIKKQTDKLDIIKPSSFKGDIETGDKVHIEMTDVHIDNNNLISIPATATFNEETVEAHFPLNTGNLRKLKNVLGSNSDKYIGATFIAVVIPRNNPQTNTEVLSWAIQEKSVKAKA